jgi:hypothetical protein
MNYIFALLLPGLVAAFMPLLVLLAGRFLDAMLELIGRL